MRQGKAAFSSKSNSILSVKCNYMFQQFSWSSSEHPTTLRQVPPFCLPLSSSSQTQLSFSAKNGILLMQDLEMAAAHHEEKKVLHNEITQSSVTWHYYLLKPKKWQTLKSVCWSSPRPSVMLKKLELHTGTCSICLMSRRHFTFSFFLILAFWHLSISFLLKLAIAI